MIKRKVAVKLIKPGLATREIVARFESERQALALMEHPGIAKAFDAGEADNGQPYFVMEYIDGQPVTNYCDDKQLNTRERLLLFDLAMAVGERFLQSAELFVGGGGFFDGALILC